MTVASIADAVDISSCSAMQNAYHYNTKIVPTIDSVTFINFQSDFLWAIAITS